MSDLSHFQEIAAMEIDPDSTHLPAPPLSRLFLREPGWRVALKVGSERTFCYHMAPGEDGYHRLMDGEIHIYRGDERLCLPCANRRGLLHFDPLPLRDRLAGFDVASVEDVTDYDLTH